MAERRMMSKKIIDSDEFTEMPLSSQALYFHLLLRADDDGFLNNAKKIMRDVGANQNDYDMLLMKRFIIQFEDGVCVIKHWRIHNYIQKDRYKPTLYTEELSLLTQKENGAYSLETNCEQFGNNLDTKCIQNDSTMSTLDAQVRLGKDRVSIDKDYIVSNDTIRRTEVQRVVDAWNTLPVVSRVTKLVPDSQRFKWLKARIRDYGIDEVLRAIDNVRNSPFLLGESKNGWTITFDWFVRPNNFPKVLDGNYLKNSPDITVVNDDGGKKWQ